MGAAGSVSSVGESYYTNVQTIFCLTGFQLNIFWRKLPVGEEKKCNLFM